MTLELKPFQSFRKTETQKSFGDNVAFSFLFFHMKKLAKKEEGVLLKLYNKFVVVSEFKLSAQ